MKKLQFLILFALAGQLIAQNKQSTINFVESAISYADTAKVTKAKLRSALVRTISFADSVKLNQKKFLYGVGDITNGVSPTANVGDWYINTTGFSIWEKTALTSPPGSGSFIYLPDAIWIKIVSPPAAGDAYLANTQTWNGENTYTQNLITGNIVPSASGLYNLGSNTFRFKTAFLNEDLYASGIRHYGNLDIGVSGGSVFARFNTTGLGLTTIAPTHTLTLGSTATGYVHYNTVDQTTNWERVRQYWNSNTYTIAMEAAGTGTAKNISFSTNGTARTFTINANPGVGGIYNFSSTTSSVQTVVGTSSTNTNSSGISAGIGVLDTYNQSSTAGFRSLWVSPNVQASSGSTQLLMDLGTNTAGGGVGTHTSLEYTTVAGLKYIKGPLLVNTTTNAGFTGADINGTARIQGAITLTNQTVTAAASAPSTHKIAISINGTTYYLLATTTP